MRMGSINRKCRHFLRGGEIEQSSALRPDRRIQKQAPELVVDFLDLDDDWSGRRPRTIAKARVLPTKCNDAAGDGR